MNERKIAQVNINKVEDLKVFDNVQEFLNCKTVFIKKKGKVVAHAQWDDWDLVVTKIRRPKNISLKIGQVLYESSIRKNLHIPMSPELKMEGVQFLRNTKYDSSRALRKDPFWKDYLGLFMIPKKVNDQDGLERFLSDYPELKEENGNSVQLVNVDYKNDSNLMMAKYQDVDSYVTGVTDELPKLEKFAVPKNDDLARYTASLCYCGCGQFEGWDLYWPNTWVVYMPRKGSNPIED